MPDDTTLWLTIEGTGNFADIKVYEASTGKVLPVNKVVITADADVGMVLATITCLVKTVHFGPKE